jgi:hypothetical protein
MIKVIQGDPMIYLQNWIDQVNPMAALPSIAILFLIATPMAAALSNAEARPARPGAH